MSLALDAIYAVAAAATAPWWMRKRRAGWAERFGRIAALPAPARPRLLIHAVSVGEVNLIRPLIPLLTPHADIVVSATTDTGLRRACELFSDSCHVVRFPLDASWSVRRFMDAVRPDAAALVELELWPNFVRLCARRAIPLAVVNGRLSERSFARYRLIRPFIRPSFRSLAFAAVQDDAYARRFRAMGVPPDRCAIAGSMKWDAADTSPAIPGAEALGREMGIDPARPLIVAGSTAPDEHELLHRATPPGVQLLCAPRKPEWFDNAAAALPGCVRRSANSPGPPGTDRFLLDTIGELRKAYALADIVVVGRSFGDLYGSDPMEPAALGKPVVIGPAVADFRSAVEALDRAGAIVRTTRQELARVLARLISDASERSALGERARGCVLANQGAARRHADMLLAILPRRGATAAKGAA